jgi:hypothetical protein
VASRKGARRPQYRGVDLIGKNLRGANLTAADVTGADLRDADLSRARLAGALFLTQAQLDSVHGDLDTAVPETLTRHFHWMGKPRRTHAPAQPDLRAIFNKPSFVEDRWATVESGQNSRRPWSRALSTAPIRVLHTSGPRTAGNRLLRLRA